MSVIIVLDFDEFSLYSTGTVLPSEDTAGRRATHWRSLARYDGARPLRQW